MPQFEPRKPIVTEDPVVTVDAGLPPGQYRAQLVVEDEAGNRSTASEQVVTIQNRPR